MIWLKAKKPTIMVILDGWGYAPAWGGNAIAEGRTRNFDRIWQSYPSTTLLSSGEAVGLPANAPGNSEAGHLNIGAGHVVHQDITLIDQKINDQSFFNNQTLLQSVVHARKFNSNVQLLGLLSETGTHSHIRHLYALLEFFKRQNFNKVFIHLFSDGRDSDPMAGIELVSRVEEKIAEIGAGKIVTVTGRFFAMDRDNRWKRIAPAYNLMVNGAGVSSLSAGAIFSSSYAFGQTDEFITPHSIINPSQQKVTIQDNDAVILFNFRSDRTRELSRAFLDKSLPEFRGRRLLNNLFFCSFAMNEENKLVHQIFEPETVASPIAKVWSLAGLRQFHTAESEKYPHVTYFINGGAEQPFPGEEREMVPSLRKVTTYDLKPKMSALGVTGVVLSALSRNVYDGIIVNFANADMVGHTGNLQAAVEAVECVDDCLGKILQKAQTLGSNVFVFADHGNAEQMVNPRTGLPDTEHTTNPVPFIMVTEDPMLRQTKFKTDGILASIAPTVLDTMKIARPETMRNQSLIINEGLIK